MTKDTPFLGIDFGTSQSSMAWFNPKTGQAEVIRNAEGEDKTPSVVYYGDSETLVGKAAEDLLENERERGRILFSVKRHLAKRIRYSLRDRHIRPVDVVAEILRKLKRDAEEGHFHEPVGRAVITHPAVFDQLEKDLLAEAARDAGFADVVLLPEPVAAAMAYAETGVKVGDHVLVYDLGGGTFDLALLDRGHADNPFSLAAEPRGLRCGGDDFDQALYDHCDAIAQQTLGRSIGKKDRRDLHFLRECRRRKENLTVRTRSEFSSYLRGGVQFKHAIDRESFEKLIGSAVQPTVSLTRAMLDEAASEGHQPDSIVLIGGSSQVPLVQRLLRETLPIEPVKWQGRDLAVALGATYHGRSIWGSTPRAREVELPVLQVLPADANQGHGASPSRSYVHSPAVPETKPCPFCAETVLAATKKCKHCGEIIDPALRARETRKTLVAAPQKSVGVAILLTVLFGPLGMFYSTLSGGVIMLVASIVLACLSAGWTIIITWPICVIWAASAAGSYNAKHRIG